MIRQTLIRNVRKNRSVLSSERKLRFRIRKGDFEVELEGDHDYVKERFEDLEKTLGPAGALVVAPQAVPSRSWSCSQ